jgi:hypothetical protein
MRGSHEHGLRRFLRRGDLIAWHERQGLPFSVAIC